MATLAEIAENNYNLNTLRYMDTFEEEKPVNLDAVSAELKHIKTDPHNTNVTIGSFC